MHAVRGYSSDTGLADGWPLVMDHGRLATAVVRLSVQRISCCSALVCVCSETEVLLFTCSMHDHPCLWDVQPLPQRAIPAEGRI